MQYTICRIYCILYIYSIQYIYYTVYSIYTVYRKIILQCILSPTWHVDTRPPPTHTHTQLAYVDFCTKRGGRVIGSFSFEKEISGGNVVGSAIPGLRAVPDLVPIHPILPPTVHIHL